MKRCWIAFWLLLILVTAVGCSEEEAQSVSGPVVYYLWNLDWDDPAGGDAIRAVPVNIPGLEEMDAKETALCLLQQMTKNGDGYVSPLPAGVTVNDVTLQGRRAYVDMSRGYGNLTGVELSLADYCITLTLCQMDEIQSVSITAGGRPVTLRDSQVLMEQDVVLSGMEDVVSTVRVQLWFLDEAGQLAVEDRELELYEGQTKVEAVADALEEGPRDRGRSAILPQGFVFGAVWLDDGVCHISIPSESMALLPQDIAEQEKILDAISSSFFSLDVVQELQFLIDGVETDAFGHIGVAGYQKRPANEISEVNE